MSMFSCPVVRVASVEPHPDPDTTRLNVVKLEGLGFTLVRNKTDDGEPRDKVGDWCVYIPSSAVLPEWLLKEMGFWNAELGKGMLDGVDGDRVKPRKLRGVFSEGLLYPVEWDDELAMEGGGSVVATPDPYNSDMHNLTQVELGEDVSELLGITKYEPMIPAHMAGEITNMMEYLTNYDFERHERVPDMFEPGEWVTATEKIHGTNMCVTWVPELRHPDMFGTDQNIIVNSKGLGAQGLAFKNNEANQHNLYVRILRDLIHQGFDQQLKTVVSKLTADQQLSITTPLTVRIWGEAYGAGVQDLHYGTKAPEFAVFDLQIGNRWLTDAELEQACVHLGVKKVPLAYKGPFDISALEAVRDGTTLMGGANIREGIVVRSENLLPHDVHGRRICKMISPDYLVRKVKNATEFQ